MRYVCSALGPYRRWDGVEGGGRRASTAGTGAVLDTFLRWARERTHARKPQGERWREGPGDCPGLTLRLSDDPCRHFSRCLLRLDNRMREKEKEQHVGGRVAPGRAGPGLPAGLGFAGIAVWTRAGLQTGRYQMGEVVGSCKRGTGVVEKDGTGGLPTLGLELEPELKLGLATATGSGHR